MEEDKKELLQEKEKEDKDLFVGISKNLSRVKKIEEVKGKIDTVRDLKEKVGELKEKIDEVKNSSNSSSGSGSSGAGNFWKYAGVAAVATPLVLFGLNHYFKFKVNPAAYYDKIKNQINLFTQTNIVLTGVIDIKNQGTPQSYLYCKITAENLEGLATLTGVVTGPSGFKKDFVLKTGVAGFRFGAVLQNEVVFEFDASLGTKGQFECRVSEMRDASGTIIAGAAGTVATLLLQ